MLRGAVDGVGPDEAAERRTHERIRAYAGATPTVRISAAHGHALVQLDAVLELDGPVAPAQRRSPMEASVSRRGQDTPASDEHRAPWPTTRSLPLRLSEARARARVRRRLKLVRIRREFGASGDAFQRSSGASARVACRPLLRFVRRSSQRLDVPARRRCSVQTLWACRPAVVAGCWPTPRALRGVRQVED